jgi:hypothetical protein
MVIEACDSPDAKGWLELRRALWPEGSEEEQRAEMAFECNSPERFAAFVAYENDSPVGLVAKAAARSPRMRCSPTKRAMRCTARSASRRPSASCTSGRN